MAAAWKVPGEPKEEVAKIVDAEKLDYELFDRWLKFLAKPPRFYPYLTKWQEMIKRGGSAAEAKKLADEFQALLLDVMFDRKEIKEENDIIDAKALTGTKKKEPAKLPSDFVTNDDFCPGCGLELKSLPIERNNLWTDVFQRDLQEGFDPAQASERIKPGLLAFRGWGLERQLSADRRRYVDGLRADIAALRKAQPPKYAFVHGVADVEKPVNLKVSQRGSPYNLGDEVPRHFLSVLSDGRAGAVHEGQRPARAGRRHPPPADRDARHRQSHLEGALRHRARRHAEQLRRRRRAADQSRAARVSGAVLHRSEAVDQAAAPRHHAERGVSAEHRARRRRTSRRMRATGSTGAPTVIA